MIFDQDIGDLFVIRVAGNIIAPSLVGSVEFAAATFGTDLVMVMGHTQCGAIQATLDYIENANSISSENIHDIVRRIKPNIYSLAQSTHIDKSEKINLAVVANVWTSVHQLSHSSRLIEALVQKDKIHIVGAVLNLSTGVVDFLKEP
jgi:carbonic anhydrase